VIGAEEPYRRKRAKARQHRQPAGDVASIQIQTNIRNNVVTLRYGLQGLAGQYTQLLRDGIPLFGGVFR
jgi:hypothetical protein